MRDVTRRGFLQRSGALLAAAVSSSAFQGPAADSLAGADAAGRLWDPNRAGRPQAPTTARDSDPAIQALEKRLKCTCGCGLDVYTCRTTDFTCTVSPEMHRDVLALLDQGFTDDEVVDAFVDRYGVTVLMAPPKRGFNLAGYFVPGLTIVAAGAVLLVALRRWTRQAAASPAAGAATGAAAAAAATPEELERLQRELDEFSA